MRSEIAALELNNTWSLVDLPLGKRALGCKWIFKIKYRSNGSIERYKVRLVIKGFTQQEGLNYTKTFSPVAKLAIVRTLLATTSIQAVQSDYSLFTQLKNGSFTALLIYVDDIVVASSHMDSIEVLQRFLNDHFIIKSIGNLRYFLSIEVARSSKGISICQRKYALDILANAGSLGSRPLKLPMDQNLKLHKDDGDPLLDPLPYRRLVGRLVYLTITRPNLYYSVQHLSQFMTVPITTHLHAAHQVLRYIKNALGQGLLFSSSSSLTLRACSDSDWAFCPDSRHSVTGFCIFLGQSLISWRSKK
ncbi:uncharacterized mitochondrial protein AtMg00810-like [Juglans microcarpa x Juglans regia]|uniref:uncharacterized mitochondrial protein AtMg00810-like n=1 Tax=Juglans microcarpa x Juglans regia TaxID=2249226 RepID=UPI001B7E5FD2|nr:uncharacterized mitochondrial protein AtMg00810-like [Juglans microcarpa x Juglans regia]